MKLNTKVIIGRHYLLLNMERLRLQIQFQMNYILQFPSIQVQFCKKIKKMMMEKIIDVMGKSLCAIYQLVKKKFMTALIGLQHSSIYVEKLCQKHILINHDKHWGSISEHLMQSNFGILHHISNMIQILL